MGAFVRLGPTMELKKIANDIAKPSLKCPPGIFWKKAKFTPEFDEIEYIELPLSDTMHAEADYEFLYGGKSRDFSFHYWVRQYKKDGKAGSIMIGLPLQTTLPIDRQKQLMETEALEKVFDSYKL